MIGYPGVGESAYFPERNCMPMTALLNTHDKVHRKSRGFFEGFLKGDELFFGDGPTAGAGLLRRGRRRIFLWLQACWGLRR